MSATLVVVNQHDLITNNDMVAKHASPLLAPGARYGLRTVVGDCRPSQFLCLQQIQFSPTSVCLNVWFQLKCSFDYLAILSVPLTGRRSLTMFTGMQLTNENHVRRGSHDGPQAQRPT